MNTPTDSSRSHTSHEEDLHKHDQHDGGPTGVAHIGHDAEEHHGEKPSMMKRVRARVRKMKDSITGHGHSHDHDHDDVHDDGEDDDDDDEMDKDSDKHATHTSQSSMPGKDGVAMQHEPKVEGKTTAEDSPMSSKPGDYQTFDPTTAKYASRQDETTLGWSRTDTGKPNEIEEQPYAPKSGTPAVATHLGGSHSTGDSEIVKEGGHEKLGGLMGRLMGDHVEENTHVPKGAREDHYHQANVTDPTSIAHSGGTHGLGDEERNVGQLGGVHGSPAHLENYPHVLDHSGEIRHGQNYEPEETDLRGGKETGLTPVLHHLDRMNIHGEPQDKQNIRSSQEESMFEPKDSPRDKKLFSGSHDGFSPEPVTSEERKYSETPHSGSQGLGDEGWHNKSEQKQENYAEMASSAGAMMAEKHKQATDSVTPKQGYSEGSFGQESPAVQALHEKHSKPGGYNENISIATAVVADKAVRAKDVVATKLGYGATHEEQPVEGDSKEGSVVETVDEVGPTTTTTTDISGGSGKGVSMKEYLVEKLKPGEDDKALSEVITEALPLHKRKEDVSKAREEEEEEEEGKKVPIKGRVTDSEEVATRLGRSEDTSHDEAGMGSPTPGKGVMERMMDAATSWYNKTDVSPTEDIKEGKE